MRSHTVGSPGSGEKQRTSLKLRFARIVSLALALAVVGCARGSMEPRLYADSSETIMGLRDYSYDFQRECFCTPDAREAVRITVRNRAVFEVRSRATGQSVGVSSGVTWPTLADIIREIDDARDSDSPVEIEYDKAGFLERVQIGSLAADAGVIYAIGRLVLE